jgi:integrase/recombinase XerD
MLERYYVKLVTVDRIRANVAVTYIEHYVAWMEAQGYSDRNVFRRVPILCQFGDFASRHGATDGWTALEHVEPFVLHWVSVHGRSFKSEVSRAPGCPRCPQPGAADA